MPEIKNCEEAVRLMEEVVSEKGADYVYKPVSLSDGSKSCFYVRDGQPSCLVGHALVRAGWTIDEVHGLDGIGNDAPTASEIYLYKEFSNLPREVCETFDAAQHEQDGGNSWGDALERARDYCRNAQAERGA